MDYSTVLTMYKSGQKIIKYYQNLESQVAKETIVTDNININNLVNTIRLTFSTDVLLTYKLDNYLHVIKNLDTVYNKINTFNEKDIYTISNVINIIKTLDVNDIVVLKKIYIYNNIKNTIDSITKEHEESIYENRGLTIEKRDEIINDIISSINKQKNLSNDEFLKRMNKLENLGYLNHIYEQFGMLSSFNVTVGSRISGINDLYSRELYLLFNNWDVKDFIQN